MLLLLSFMGVLLMGSVPPPTHAATPHRPQRMAHTHVTYVQPRLGEWDHQSIQFANSGSPAAPRRAAIYAAANNCGSTEDLSCHHRQGRAPPYSAIPN